MWVQPQLDRIRREKRASRGYHEHLGQVTQAQLQHVLPIAPRAAAYPLHPRMRRTDPMARIASTQPVPSAAVNSSSAVPTTTDPVMASATAQQAAAPAATAQRLRVRLGIGARGGRRMASPRSVIAYRPCTTRRARHPVGLPSMETAGGAGQRIESGFQTSGSWPAVPRSGGRTRPTLLSLPHLAHLYWPAEPGGRMTKPLILPLASGDPQHLGGHQLIGLLGHGGMGRVYLGISPDGGQVAVK